MLVVRAEVPGDIPTIRRINESAFERPNEGDLVDALRRAAGTYLSLVAEQNGKVVGHILFTEVRVESDAGSWNAVGLAPMAVVPEYQRQAIGSLLVRSGLDACARQGHTLVVVLGHPTYYPRFGFVPAAPKGLRCEYTVPDEVFMVAELVPGALNGRGGLVRYRPEFSKV
jgi:putative acetyltransferase